MAMDPSEYGLPVLACRADAIVEAVFERDRRVLLFGPAGSGKSTLAARLAQCLAAAGRRCSGVCADPGSPAFGLPGAVSLAVWQGDGWRVSGHEALCTLDAGRFRLPLVTAVRRLIHGLDGGVLLVDGPGVVRGVAGRELLQGLFEASGAEAVLALCADPSLPPLLDELRALPGDVFVVQAPPAASPPGRRARARRRTAGWDAYLRDGGGQVIDLDRVNLYGTPPPAGEGSAWVGRQAALLRRGRTVAMAEVTGLQGGRLTVMVPAAPPVFDGVLVRDARRSADGLVETAVPFAAGRLEYLPPPDMTVPVVESGGPRVAGRVGAADVYLVNGVFGDPLLHLRLRHQRRSLLFDLGDGSRLPARIAHQVTDVFISHAHMDHIGGFLWLLRSRMGEFPPCRLYGPPGLARHIEGFLQGILWDRLEGRGPVFEVTEVHPDVIRRFRLLAGRAREALGETAPAQGVVLQERGFRVRAQTLDHHTPVLAYAFEPVKEINVRKDRLTARGLAPGPWLAELKQRLLAGDESAVVRLPDGSESSAAALAADLVLITPAKRLVYATDLADTPDNRRSLQALARYAHTLFCEAYFIEADTEHAVRTGHLTARACGEIAAAAEVVRLVPFHFSQRYAEAPRLIYDEVRAACPRTAVPGSMGLFEVMQAGGQEDTPISD
jgi:ribonuclease Z